VECPILCLVSHHSSGSFDMHKQEMEEEEKLLFVGRCVRIFRPNRMTCQPSIDDAVGPSFVRPLIRINYSISRNRIIGVL
jgi:hypothetical protein